jgi:hypothetical protein
MECVKFFANPIVVTALLDRLLHQMAAIQIKAAAYRLRRHFGLGPEHEKNMTRT